jgi:hypothetical protein
MIRAVAAMFGITLAWCATARAELVDNPAYVSWATHTVGTRVMLQTTATMQGITLPSSSTLTLLQTTPDKVVVEASTSMEIAGAKQENKRQVEIPARVERGSENLPNDTVGTTKLVGNEKVTIAGKSYDCKLVEFTGQNKDRKVTGRIWATEEIPGGMAKQETKIETPRQATVLTTVTKFEEK